MKKVFCAFIGFLIFACAYSNTLSVPISITTGNITTLQVGSALYGLFRNYEGKVNISMYNSITQKWTSIISLPEYAENCLYWASTIDEKGIVVPDKSIFVYQGVENINVMGINFSTKTETQLANFTFPNAEGEEGAIMPNFTMYNGKLIISMGGSSNPLDEQGWTVDYSQFLK